MTIERQLLLMTIERQLLLMTIERQLLLILTPNNFSQPLFSFPLVF